MKMIHTKNAPAAVGPYSQAVEVNGTLYVSGQIPFVPETMTLVSESIKDQTRQSLTNILGIVVITDTFESGSPEILIDCTNLSAGQYFSTIKSSGKAITLTPFVKQ